MYNDPLFLVGAILLGLMAFLLYTTRPESLNK